MIYLVSALLIVSIAVIVILGMRLKKSGKDSFIDDIDSLTGLPKYQAFQHAVSGYLAGNPGRGYVVGHVRLRNFRTFNSTYGTVEGDNLLAATGEFLREAVKDHRSGIVAAGTYNAGRFIICCDTSATSPDRVYDMLSGFLREYRQWFDFSPVMGFCHTDKQNQDIRVCCDNAAAALSSIYDAYDVHYAMYDEKLGQAMKKEAGITASMNKALENGEFIAYLQPQVNYETRSMIGAEVLVRWKKADGSMVSPTDFIPTFEKNGFIYEMDKYIWEQACRMIRDWDSKGYDLPSLSVNVSRRDIYHASFVDTLVELVRKYGIEPSRLHLEVTESAYSQDPEQLVRILAVLKANGFTIEMDDFGSGYSSLNALREMPVDIIKLDSCFLKRGDWGHRAGKIITSVIRMAHIIDIPVIAEGVETKDDADYLKSVGCLQMQGYYFARPMSAADFEEFLKNDASIGSPRKFAPGFADAVDFFDINSQSTLIFNSYVGGAAILEYGVDGKLSILRMNDRFFNVVGMDREEYKKRQYDVLAGLDPESAKAIAETLDTVSRTGEEGSCNVHSPNIDGKGRDLWTSCRVRFLALKAETRLYYLSIDDITERVLLNRRNRDLTVALEEREDLFMHAAEQVDMYYWKYNIQTKEMYPCFRCQKNLHFPSLVENYPEPGIDMCIFPPDQADFYRELMKRVDAGEDDVEAVVPLTMDHIPYRINYSIERDEQGNAKYAYGTALPVSATEP